MSRIPVPSTSPSHLRSHSPVPLPPDSSVPRHNTRPTSSTVSAGMSSLAGYQSPLSETRKKQSKRDEVTLLDLFPPVNSERHPL